MKKIVVLFAIIALAIASVSAQVKMVVKSGIFNKYLTYEVKKDTSAYEIFKAIAADREYPRFEFSDYALDVALSSDFIDKNLEVFCNLSSQPVYVLQGCTYKPKDGLKIFLLYKEGKKFKKQLLGEFGQATEHIHIKAGSIIVSQSLRVLR